ncbi:50S ribosomal protein L11 methyltransferase [Sandarakinorhabdus sp.]|uniref:50S ribosomal protein L11 methyltransferase n=1 Tax=Sandarakinorhabdus sp. TaxID=1916663 RepID=UPI00286E3A7E|nr:50S ribosomal protein L11 methyltransferase [Sandarakinorhabdus sp.]
MTVTLTLWCNRRDAENLPEIGDIFPELIDPPTLNVEEPDPDQPDDWLLTAYFAQTPPQEWLDRITAHFPSARDILVAELPEDDWTTLSQRGLEPVRAGRFIVHTRAHADKVRPGDRAIAIEAGLAFGTGQHATTLGCLAALDRLARRQRFHNIADIGTGTGVLALAAMMRWPDARITASDIDPISIAVTNANVRDNGQKLGSAAGHALTLVAPGMESLGLSRRAPYDLIFANILAPPLIAISRDLACALAPGGVLVLAGLLRHQARAVANAYRKHGLVPAQWPRRAEWPCLVLTRKAGV